MLPHFQHIVGASFPHANMMPPGSRVVAFVRASGPRSGETLPASMFHTTLNAALNKCTAGAGDIVVVMPDHVESISSADQMSNLVAGTTILGAGYGALRPTFNWTAAASSFLFDVANVRLHNCILNLAGSRTSTTAVTVAAPITVSAAGCGIYGCEINFGVDVDQIVTVGITTTAAGDDFEFKGNFCFGATAAECTTFMRLVGADRANISDCDIVGATSAVAIGLIQFITTDSTDVRLEGLRIRNNKAASTAAITVSAGATSSSGWVDKIFLTVLGNGANQLILGHADGAFAASVAAFTFGRFVNVANLAGERAAEVTVVSA